MEFERQERSCVDVAVRRNVETLETEEEEDCVKRNTIARKDNVM